jgi:hypothetical protein
MFLGQLLSSRTAFVCNFLRRQARARARVARELPGSQLHVYRELVSRIAQVCTLVLVKRIVYATKRNIRH